MSLKVAVDKSKPVDNVYTFIWKEGKPYIKLDGKEVPIYNLHIHCKDLKKFVNM